VIKIILAAVSLMIVHRLPPAPDPPTLYVMVLGGSPADRVDIENIDGTGLQSYIVSDDPGPCFGPGQEHGQIAWYCTLPVDTLKLRQVRVCPNGTGCQSFQKEANLQCGFVTLPIGAPTNCPCDIYVSPPGCTTNARLRHDSILR
jgi:hypothetical protein